MITKKLAHFVVETSMSDIPQEALTVAQMGITDFIGVTFPGSLEPSGKIVRDYVQKMGAVAESSVIGTNLKASPYLAALANGTMGHALDYDDMGGFGHSSAVLAPAVLAIGESIGASGKEILTAHVIGFELAGCLCGPIRASHVMRGWHATNTFGSLGAGAAVAWLLKLDVKQVSMTLGIAASIAGGLKQNFGTMTKPLHAGKAAANGIQAALLAQAGFTADDNIIEAPFGFAKVFGHDQDVDWERASESLGKTFNITSPDWRGIAIKPYPVCGSNNGGIDAALFTKKEYGLKSSDDIAEIELGTNPAMARVLIHHCPRTGLEGKFSLEYTVARALHSGEVRLRHFTDEAVNELPVKKLMELMKWVEKYPMPSQQQDVLGSQSLTIKLLDGKRYAKEVSIPRGFPQNPLTPEEFTSKYVDCASTVLPKERVDMSLGMLSNFVEVKNIKELMKILTNN